MNRYLYVTLSILCVVILTTNTNAFPGDLVEPIDKPFVEHYKSDELDFLTIGDWGLEGISQTNVAKAMEKWGGKYHSDFIINVGGMYHFINYA